MRNIKLTLAYDGTDYYGWAIQPNVPTIQGTVVDILERITQERIRLHGCGRTDAGVHALGQVAHCKLRSTLPAEKLQRALNCLLPPSIRVTAVKEVPGDFHARWHAKAKTYRYRILRAPVCPPFVWRYVYHYPFPLDTAAIARALPQLIGEHNFTSFSSWASERDEEKNKVRTVLAAEVAELETDQELVFTFHGRAFLRHMVRKMVGTLIEVGKGRLPETGISEILAARDRTCSGPTVPPSGLCLVSVDYPEPYR
ncbi:MAG: tRNA pseudouridine(38-40) synthase TruA [Terriglobia bacterium]